MDYGLAHTVAPTQDHPGLVNGSAKSADINRSAGFAHCKSENNDGDLACADKTGCMHSMPRHRMHALHA